MLTITSHRSWATRHSGWFSVPYPNWYLSYLILVFCRTVSGLSSPILNPTVQFQCNLTTFPPSPLEAHELSPWLFSLYNTFGVWKLLSIPISTYASHNLFPVVSLQAVSLFSVSQGLTPGSPLWCIFFMHHTLLFKLVLRLKDCLIPIISE